MKKIFVVVSVPVSGGEWGRNLIKAFSSEEDAKAYEEYLDDLEKSRGRVKLLYNIEEVELYD